MSGRSMNQYGGSRPRPSRAPATQKCQKCLHLGHYTYECRNEAPYKPRPSRTALLSAGKASAVRDRPSVEVPEEFLPKKGTAARILEERERLRAERDAADKGGKSERKSRGRSRSVSSSSSSSGSSSSGSDSDSDSRSSRSSRSSSRSRSRSPPRRRSRRDRRDDTPSRSRSRSRSPVARADKGKGRAVSRSRSVSSSRSRSRSPVRRRREDSPRR